MRNQIHIIADYYLSADKHSYTLIYRRPKMDAPNLGLRAKEDTYIYEELGYYNSLRSLLTALQDVILRKEIESGELKTMGEILYRLDTIQKALDDLNLE